MKIDLHCHTKKVKKGDAATRNVTAELFRDKIELADVKIVAITNHNAFDLEQYRVLKEKVLDICQVWPGVEIDVGGETRFHLIVVVKPEEEIRFSAAVDKLFEGEDLNKCLHSLEEICAAFQEFEALFIPHFHDKKPAISVSDKEKLARLVGDPSRVFIEPRNHRTLGVLTELAQRRKYVVIATHNANIAVRTLPYMSIFRTHENGEYKTYIGNPFDDRLVNIENQTDVKSWTEESMHSLEGGSEAFYERRDIYESRDN